MTEWYGNIKASELELVHAPTNKVFPTWESAKNYEEKLKLDPHTAEKDNVNWVVEKLKRV